MALKQREVMNHESEVELQGSVLMMNTFIILVQSWMKTKRKSTVCEKNVDVVKG